MKSITHLLFVFCIGWGTNAQNYRTVDDLNDACSQLGFMTDQEAHITVDKILEQLGLFRNFVIQECPEINNAVAKNIEVSPGQKERFILYDKDFFSRISSSANTDWAATSILAHEIVHHLNGHALNNQGSNHKWELEADEFSGFVLARMGSSLEEAQAAILTLTYSKATRTHPAKADRLVAIKTGWGKVKKSGNTGVSSKELQASARVKQALEAYQDYNYQLANELFLEAQESGNPDTFYYLSQSYYVGHGVEIDYKKAYALAKEGYDKGSIPATYQLAKYFANGIGIVKDTVASARLFAKDFQLKWFKDQFEKTNLGFHAYTLGYIYQKGYAGVEVDYKQAVFWYDKASALGDPLALNNLGAMYNTGEYFNKDSQKALAYFQEAAKLDFSIAYANLANHYNSSDHKDENEAAIWLKKAALKGDAISQSVLAGYYYEGRGGLKKDYKKSFFWNKKSAEQGNLNAQFNLAYSYFFGLGTNADQNEAIKWWKASADRGFLESNVSLGTFYLNAEGLTQDYVAARAYVLPAAEQGHALAQYYMGVIYLNGWGVLNDLYRAADWFQKSASQNNAHGQYLLGQMYYKGNEALKRDKKKGIALMQLAARQGMPQAQNKLTELKKKW